MSKKKKRKPLPELTGENYVIDSHCHLDMKAYREDCQAVIKRSLAAGVKKIMTIGIDLESSKAALQLAREYPEVFCSVGVHPHNVQEITDQDYEEIANLSGDPKVKAYGEIGLDYFKGYASKEIQLEHFRRQVDLAKDLSLPLIIHDRDAHDDVMKILQHAAPFENGGVMHCFSGDTILAQEVLDLGFYISIPGVVTFKKAQSLQEVVREVPLSSLILETDGPFLSPDPWRGHRNEPVYVLYTALKVAQLKSITLDEVAMQTTANTIELFGLET